MKKTIVENALLSLPKCTNDRTSDCWVFQLPQCFVISFDWLKSRCKIVLFLLKIYEKCLVNLLNYYCIKYFPGKILLNCVSILTARITSSSSHIRFGRWSNRTEISSNWTAAKWNANFEGQQFALAIVRSFFNAIQWNEPFWRFPSELGWTKYKWKKHFFSQQFTESIEHNFWNANAI